MGYCDRIKGSGRSPTTSDQRSSLERSLLRDDQLIALVRALARQAARDAFAATSVCAPSDHG